MKTPVATYRVQLNKTFDFENLKTVVPYLSELGISHVYASPIFEAKKGSMHGYDIISPDKISEELGGRKAFESLAKQVSAYGLEWLQDIVPNHASYSLENKMIYDLMQKGPNSKYYAFFDVNWSYPSSWLKGKILAPFLAEPYLDCLKKRLIALTYENNFKIRYNGTNFPINNQTIKKLLGSASLNEVLERYNGNPALLAELLSEQFFALSHWQAALTQINYRRFFDIISLIGVCVENERVFEEVHRLIYELTDLEIFTALRIDHIDGLYNPEEYLKKIRQRLPDKYIIVEKILTDNEQLPDSWPIQGTTGYDFLNSLNKVFIQTESEAQSTNLYKQFTANKQAFSDLLYDCKKSAIKTHFLGDIRNLARLISTTLRKIGYTKARTDAAALREAVVELLSCFPLYRTYISEQNYPYQPFKIALDTAMQKNPKLSEELASISFLLQQSQGSREALHAMMRLQQFTGAIMAKGLEDTAFYRYNRFISVNEVGSNPSQFGFSTEEFHEFNTLRLKKWPLTLNATSTHDNKRGEDVRARLNVLSEIPQEFKTAVESWAEANIHKKKRINKNLAPSRNEEYYLYQTLIGAFPWYLGEKPEFTERLKLHMVKALREAKQSSNWLTPNLPYEQAVVDFADEILTNDTFFINFLPLQKRIAFYGFFNTLAQTLIKITCPGVADFYQGAELWDLNLVDPDNRRPVNFQERLQLLSEISRLEPSKVRNLLEYSENAKAKLYVIYKALQFRRKFKELFADGSYVPLAVKGKRSKCVIAFRREKGQLSAIVVVPRFLTGLIDAHKAWERENLDWVDTCIPLPKNAPSSWTDLFTDRTVTAKAGCLPVAEVLEVFPVALLHLGDMGG